MVETIYACANVSISNLKFPPTGYRIGQVQPRFLYSSTLLFASAGVPEAVIRCTRSSGTRCLALLICSLVAGQPKIDWILLITSCETREALAICGCCARY